MRDATDGAMRVPAEVLAPDRLRAVAGTGLLDRPPEPQFDELTSLAARLLDAPWSFLSVLDDDRAFWASSAGIETDPDGGRQTPLEASFCQYVVADAAPVRVDDALEAPRFRDNVAVQRMGVRAYLGCPFTDLDGYVLGSLCVVDQVPHVWDATDLEIMQVLARAASAQVALAGHERAARTTRDEADRARLDDARTQARLTRMAAIALRLTASTSVEELSSLVVRLGLPVLGADGGALLLREGDERVVRMAVAHDLGRQVQQAYGEVSLDSRLPAVVSARTGRRVLLPDRASGLAFTPEMAAVYASTQRSAWAFCPLKVADRVLGSLAVSWDQEQSFAADDLALLDGLAAQVAQALDRIQREQDQLQRTVEAQRVSETLQRSLLTQPVVGDGLSVSVRYLPAAQEARVGGDWYDVFRTQDGSTLLVIGDVVGHDVTAAATMGQLRNLVRGLAYDSTDAPARLLSRLDGALHGLHFDTLATAVVARLDAWDVVAAGRRPAARTLTWSSAGHPPPLLRAPDGAVRVLGGEQADLLLGLQPGTGRTDHAVELPAGATLLLYTDGLVERRDRSLDDGIDWLMGRFFALGHLEPGALCDALLTETMGPSALDDIALLVLRVGADTAA